MHFLITLQGYLASPSLQSLSHTLCQLLAEWYTNLMFCRLNTYLLLVFIPFSGRLAIAPTVKRSLSRRQWSFPASTNSATAATETLAMATWLTPSVLSVRCLYRRTSIPAPQNVTTGTSWSCMLLFVDCSTKEAVTTGAAVLQCFVSC